MKSKTIINAIIVALLTVTTTISLMAAPKNTISFYKVPLVCSAAPSIGCGSKAKPVLEQLEKNNNVDEAWLNHTGTVIAVKWKSNINSATGQNNINSLFKEQNLNVTMVSGKEYDAMLKNFNKKTDWLRYNEMDKLSMIEAGEISSRLVARVNAKTPLNNETAFSLKTDFENLFKKRFTTMKTSNINKDPDVVATIKQKMENDLLAAGKKYLDASQMNALQDAIALSLQPVEGENDKAADACCSKPKGLSQNKVIKQKEVKGCCSKPSN